MTTSQPLSILNRLAGGICLTIYCTIFVECFKVYDRIANMSYRKGTHLAQNLCEIGFINKDHLCGHKYTNSNISIFSHPLRGTQSLKSLYSSVAYYAPVVRLSYLSDHLGLVDYITAAKPTPLHLRDSGKLSSPSVYSVHDYQLTLAVHCKYLLK